MMSTMAMPAGSIGSRYRKLRGKSVSETHKAVEHALGEQMDDSSLVPSQSTLGSSGGWRECSNAQGNVNTVHVSGIDPHYPVPPVPLPPSSQKDHAITTRPRAAVMPPGPLFGQPISPTPLRIRQSSQALTPQPQSAPDTTASTDVTVSDHDHHQRKDSGQQSTESVHDEPEDHPMGEKEALLLADRLEAETDRMLAEQKELDLKRLHHSMIGAGSRASLASSSATRTPGKSPALERFGFFYRGRRSHATLSPASSTTASVDFSRAQSVEPLLTPRTYLESSMQLMTPPTSPMSPQHKHDNLINVRYRGEQVKIAIMDNTDTVDVLRQAAALMSNPVNTAASIVHECYAPLGLERRVRRYERIRDVLDSWPQDAQNSLVIRHAYALGSDKDLDISYVALTEIPPTFTLQLYHCTRPGKWHKRWITLLRDGKMLSSKKATAVPLEKDYQRLCDLSHYDIYEPICEPALFLNDGTLKSPGASPIKTLKPPKRYVYAVKSQERPATYRDATNQVHFFCTEDPDVARKFQTLVHTWRSWYMVKVRRDTQRKEPMDMDLDPPPRITPVRHQPMKSVSHIKVSPGHKMKISVDKTPYTIGDLQPLLDLERFDKPIDEFGIDWVPDPRNSALSPVSPGFDSGVSVSTPSTAGVLGPGGKGNLEVASPSEERRKRRDMKRSLASIESGQQQYPFSNGSVNIHIAVTEPPAPFAGRPRSDATTSDTFGTAPDAASPSPPEPAPWLPSAAEHTAKVRAEQAQLERINNPPFTPLRPSTSSAMLVGWRGSKQAPNPERRGGRFSHRVHTQPSLPSNLIANYREALQWAEPTSGSFNRGSKFLDVPGNGGGNGRSLTSMSSMPVLAESPSPNSNKRGVPVPSVPAVWREGSMSSLNRPSTSGGERAASSRQPRGRTGSVSSLRRGYSAIGAPPGEAPPMPPMPLRHRPVAASVAGGRPPMMLRDTGRSLTARP